MLNHTEWPSFSAPQPRKGSPPGRFQLDHFGAEIGQDACTEGRSYIMTDFQNLQPKERQIAYSPPSDP
jgi:hypothetical protein